MGMEALSLFLATILAVGMGNFMMRDQERLDEERMNYVVIPPSDIKTEDLFNWVMSLSGVFRRGEAISSKPTIVFETWWDSRGMAYRLRIPKRKAAFVVSQLQTIVQGAHITYEDTPPEHDWSYSVELKESSPANSLRVKSPEAVSLRLISAVGSLTDAERVMWQLVLRPMRPARKPDAASMKPQIGDSWAATLLGMGHRGDAIEDVRSKLDHPNFIGAARVAAKAETKAQARLLISNVTDALSSTNNQHNEWERKLVSPIRAAEGIKRGTTPFFNGVQLSSVELTGLLAWGIGQPIVAGYPQGKSRQLPPNESIARTGRVVAVSNFHGRERPLAISPRDALMHTYVVGPSGVGKTWALANMAIQDIEAGHGVVIVDPKKDPKGENLFGLVLDRIPRHRLQDVVVFDIRDTLYPPGFNVLQGNPEAVANNLQALVDSLFPVNAGGVMLQKAIYHAVKTLMTSTAATKPMTLAELIPLCMPRGDDQVAFSDALTRGVAHDEGLSRYWESAEVGIRNRAKTFEPFINRMWQFDGRDQVRRIVGQEKSTIDLFDIVRNQKILLINLAGEDEKTVRLLGSLIVNGLWNAVEGGASSPDRPTFLYLDEFHLLRHTTIPFAEMLSLARSMGLGITMAHQNRNQLRDTSPGFIEDVLSNARTKMIFGNMSAGDAAAYAREFGRGVQPDDLLRLDKFDVMLKIASETGASTVSGKTARIPNAKGTANSLRRVSRQQYGTPVADVDAQIKARRSTGVVTAKAKNIGKFKAGT